jgi:hypothetical protein
MAVTFRTHRLQNGCGPLQTPSRNERGVRGGTPSEPADTDGVAPHTVVPGSMTPSLGTITMPFLM